MEYNFSTIEKLARKKWKDNNVYKVSNDPDKPKYYVLDMFPYPSGAGLHVGHPLGYIFSDIYARYKRMQGYKVLHPMGFDAFGLPAEQYAIQTGQHPAITTEQNIINYKNQFEKIGFCFDWNREVSTCDPSYYKWTQWIFLQLYDSWYNKEEQQSERIGKLVKLFEESGNASIPAACDEKVIRFTADEWKQFPPLQRQDILMDYRLAYRKESFVNWCPALGTVLANDEIVNGVSERGGYPVEKKKMSQWFLRITAYAERLLNGLETLEWGESMKDMQRNWIGKSIGAMVSFPLKNREQKIEVFTTRVDTIFGVSFLVIAPEHELVKDITTAEYKSAVDDYVKACAAKSDIERQAEKAVSGQFTGAYVLHPFTRNEVPVYIADYVLAGYGTGAVMAVPSGDQRDYLFAKKFSLPVIPILDAQQNLEQEADATKDGTYVNSDFINGLKYKEATALLIQKLREKKLGFGKINYKMRDAGYSRQRYWGEPFPIYYDSEGLVHTIDEKELPVTLPQVESYRPTGTGESPVAHAKEWVARMGDGTHMETDTMPGYAGSSWYFLRYMDPRNDTFFAGKEAIDYWQNVDLYVGGSEHAVGHLLYARFWHKFLKDNGWVNTEEPFRKMVNQGMIQGRSLLTKEEQIDHLGAGLHIPLAFASGDKIFKDKFILLQKEDNRFENVDPEKDVHWEKDKDGKEFLSLSPQVEKMSKRYLNVVNPDDVVEQYGADTFRMYEMFLGPIDTAKPWDTNGISGVANFIRKFWRLFYDDNGRIKFSATEPAVEELKILHKTIRRVSEDIERFGFNTCVSSFMIGVNELSKLKSVSKTVLVELVKLIAPFAPHTAEVLWSNLGNETSVADASFPVYSEAYLAESAFNYPIQINGRHRGNIEIPLDMEESDIRSLVLADERISKFIDKPLKKFIVVKGRIVNVVL
jgi:leucyl-tRNA synthetase